MTCFIHPQAICESELIGSDTRIWAFAHVLPGARVGCDCNICDHVFIENDVVLGDRVTVKCGVQLWDGTRIDDDVFIGPNATFTNDKMPRSKQHLASYPETHVACGASIGANATILPGVTVGRLAMVGAGCVVTKDVPPRAIVTGNPGRIVGYVDAQKQAVRESVESGAGAMGLKPRILSSGVTVHALKSVADLRGMLSVGQFDDDIPFRVERFFLVHDVPSKHIRGEHAHKTCQQFLICVKGSISVVSDNGRNREEVTLDRPDIGLHVPPMVWCVQYKYSADAVLLVFASEKYDASDYIRNYDEYLKLVGAMQRPQQSS